MRIKQHVNDFRVRELLVDGYLCDKGPWRVYRVTKKKSTSLEAAAQLADVLGVAPSDVSMAGLKDRQGVTMQHMAVHGGKPLEWRDQRMMIAPVGCASEELTSALSRGNAFEIMVRDLTRKDLHVLRLNVPLVREHGLVNYFDEQRFGNVRHGQGWIARDLMRGRHERALKQLLTAVSPHESARELEFKSALERGWGDWVTCREAAGRYGRHHSLFEHLKKDPQDFAGAFFHVSSRLRLIHLFAWQSHIWNRAVCDYLEQHIPDEERVTLQGIEGPLVHPAQPYVLDPSMQGGFRLPGACLEGVTHPDQRACFEEVLAREHMVAADFEIRGVSGFQLKGEERAFFSVPAHLRVRPPESDRLNRQQSCVRIRFELPRGAYATQVVRRLLSSVESPAGRIEGKVREKDRGRVHRDGANRDRDKGRGGKDGARGRYDAAPRKRGAGDRETRDRGPQGRGPQDGGARKQSAWQRD